MANNLVSISIDFAAFVESLRQRKEAQAQDAGNTRQTIFALGESRRVRKKPPVGTPNFYQIEIVKDRMNNPYLHLFWQLNRKDITSGRVSGFHVYRRKLDKSQSVGVKTMLELNRTSMEQLAQGNKTYGSFSEERRSIYNVSRGLIPEGTLNPELAQAEAYSQAQQFGVNISPDSPGYVQSRFEAYVANAKFEKIAYVNYTNFIQDEMKKQVFVSDRKTASINFKDKKVSYGETFEYYIESVSSEIGGTVNSAIITVTVEDTSVIDPPQQLIAKQISDTAVRLSILINPVDLVKNVFILRRPETDISFRVIGVVENVGNSIKHIDQDVKVGVQYEYRAFLQNIHGYISPPGETTVFVTSKSAASSRYNGLKTPVFEAVQDQNSDFIKISIFPNDPLISYYDLTRRDLTIHDQNYAAPGKDSNYYGGTGWETNKFYVQKRREPIDRLAIDGRGALPTPTVDPGGGRGARASVVEVAPGGGAAGEAVNWSLLDSQVVMDEINFVDNLVYVGHIYQYRVIGFDTFGNRSSAAFVMVKCAGKKSIRTPVNVRQETIRPSPFRCKVLWDDDNVSSFPSEQELFEGQSPTESATNKIIYNVQRRQAGERTYERFPPTVNTFLIDEVSSLDAITFDGTRQQVTITNSNPAIPVPGGGGRFTLGQSLLSRPFGMPNFLQNSKIYYYKIAAKNAIQEESNFSKELRVFAGADVSPPLNFEALIKNPKIKPRVAILGWDIDFEKVIPDHWEIERKVDSPNDRFVLIGRSYLDTSFFDRDVQFGRTYIYRVRSVDPIGRKSAYVEAAV